jgi:chromosome segregation ATPase
MDYKKKDLVFQPKKQELESALDNIVIQTSTKLRNLTLEKHKIEEDNNLIIAQKKQLQITIEHLDKEINDKSKEIDTNNEDITNIEEQTQKLNEEINELMASLKIKRDQLKKTINTVGQEEEKNDVNNQVEESMKKLVTKLEYDKFLEMKDKNTSLEEQLEHLQRELYYLEVINF